MRSFQASEPGSGSQGISRRHLLKLLATAAAGISGLSLRLQSPGCDTYARPSRKAF